MKNDDTNNPGPGVDSSTGDASADGYSDASDGAAACLDDTGLAPTCEGANLSCAAICAPYLTNYKKGVARSIADCIVKLPTCESAANEVAACVQTALAAACPDPAAEGYCDPLVAACNDADGGADAGADGGAGGALTKKECIDLATGLSSAGKAEFTSCIQEGDGGAGYCKPNPTTCIDAIE